MSSAPGVNEGLSASAFPTARCIVRSHGCTPTIAGRLPACVNGASPRRSQRSRAHRLRKMAKSANRAKKTRAPRSSGGVMRQKEGANMSSDFKKLVRQRMRETGERYTTARAALLSAQQATERARYGEAQEPLHAVRGVTTLRDKRGNEIGLRLDVERIDRLPRGVLSGGGS